MRVTRERRVRPRRHVVDGICCWCHDDRVVVVRFHPKFVTQLADLQAQPDLNLVVADVLALVDALAEFGHDLEGTGDHDASHPIVISRFHTFALRRTPPTAYTPTARRPPVLRIPYVWFTDTDTADELAVVMCLGDKTRLGSQWYSPTVAEIETRLIPSWSRSQPAHQPKVRRTR